MKYMKNTDDNAISKYTQIKSRIKLEKDKIELR